LVLGATWLLALVTFDSAPRVICVDVRMLLREEDKRPEITDKRLQIGKKLKHGK
jgi:hypothetical protein